MADSTFDRLAKKMTTHVNKQRGGQKYVRTKDAQGRSIHLYAGGKRVVTPGLAGDMRSGGASPGASTKPGGKTSSPAIRWGGTKLNDVAGNPRQGSKFREGKDTAGNRYHRYAEEAGGIPRETYRIKPKSKGVAEGAAQTRRKSKGRGLGGSGWAR